VQSGK